MAEDTNPARWEGRLYPQPIDPRKDAEERQGRQAGLAGATWDGSKSDAWKRGYEIGEIRRIAARRDS